MPDACFAHPRLAAIYDDLDGDRRDLDLYVEIVEEFDARSVLDLGCGTGVFARRIAATGRTVVGVDPAAKSLVVAQRGDGADRVMWVCGDLETATEAGVKADVITMTGNVAQVFVSDDEWRRTLLAARRTLRPGGHLVFETRLPARRAWEDWTRERTRTTTATVEGRVESWVDVTAVAPPLVSFRWSYRFLDDGSELTSDSTLRFRELDEIHTTLSDAHFAVVDVRDAPDRPGSEWVVIARADGVSSGV